MHGVGGLLARSTWLNGDGMSAGQTSERVSELIIQKLSEAGIPHYEASRRSGIPRSTLSRMLSHQSDWLLPELFIMAEYVLGTKVSTLLQEAEATV